jgi:CRP/FNR family transcriptional regulator, cyclic AMP receptor protein
VTTGLLTARAERVSVIREDAELAARLSPARRAQAEAASAARVVHVQKGRWDARADASIARDGLGLLVMDGMLVRRVAYDGHAGAELLGPGDVLRAWEHDGEEAVLPFDAHWRVLAPLRLAVLDLAWATRMAPFPEVVAELFGRSHRRSRRLASMLVIAQQRRLDNALWLFFWELADRYGVVRRDGVHVPLRLTHELIGYLVGAQRPSVSTALKRLHADGRVSRHGEAWILHGDPPSAAEL